MNSKAGPLLLTALFTEGCIAGDCTDTPILDLASPTGEYVASVFERDCGATTRVSTHLELRHADPTRSDSQQTILVIEAPDGEFAPVLQWSDAKRLRVGLSSSRVFEKAERWGEVQIEYF